MLRASIWIVVALVLIVGALWIFQRRLIYLPSGDVPPLPHDAGGWFEVTLDTADGLELGGWMIASDEPSPVVVVFNGNAGNRTGRIGLGNRLADQGFAVLLFDYRGYGGNQGRPTESGLALDARAAVARAVQRFPDAPLVYFGESLGAAVAVETANEHRPDALILRSPFTSLSDAAAVHYGWLPVRALLWDEFPVVEQIGNIDSPLLVVAGSADGTIPIDQSREVLERAAGPGELLEIEGADHNDAALVHGDAMVDHVARFVRAALGNG